jgi:hypothetical protein
VEFNIYILLRNTGSEKFTETYSLGAANWPTTNTHLTK